MTMNTMSWAWDQNLPCEQKFVLVTLCDCNGMARQIVVDHHEVAVKCGLETASIPAILMALNQSGHLRVIGRIDNDLQQTACQLGFPQQDFEMSSQQTAKSTKTAANNGWVYVLSGGPNVTKVGITEHIDKRVTDISNASGLALNVAWTFACRMEVARVIERRVLDDKRLNRTRGEWLANTAAYVIAIAQVIANEEAAQTIGAER